MEVNFSYCNMSELIELQNHQQDLPINILPISFRKMKVFIISLLLYGLIVIVLSFPYASKEKSQYGKEIEEKKQKNKKKKKDEVVERKSTP